MAEKENEYKKLKNKTHEYYSKIGSVFCPHLKSEIRFNSHGFWHLIYTGRNKKRDRETQVLRFKLLKKAVALLSITTTLQEFEERKNKKIAYFGFIAIIDGWKIKAIVKKVGNGAFCFWSVIPNWITSPKRDRILHKGNMEAD